MDTIRPLIKTETTQRSPYRHPTHQRNDESYGASSTTFLGDGPLIEGSSSSLDTIGCSINHENPQLRPYPSSTTLQSNGSIYNASFMTSPSYISSIVVQNYIAEVCRSGHDHSLFVLSGFKRYVTTTPSSRTLQALPIMPFRYPPPMSVPRNICRRGVQFVPTVLPTLGQREHKAYQALQSSCGGLSPRPWVLSARTTGPSSKRRSRLVLPLTSCAMCATYSRACALRYKTRKTSSIGVCARRDSVHRLHYGVLSQA